MKASRGSSRSGIAPNTIPAGSWKGTSFMLWTARSIRPSTSASSISFVKSPFPPIFARGTSRILSPVVLIGTSSTANSGQRCSSWLFVQFACQSARALPRVPSRRVRTFIWLNVEDLANELGEISALRIVGHLLQLLDRRMQDLVHDRFCDLIHGCLLFRR